MEKLQCRMDEVLYREEMMWLQRSMISWLKEGDRNTKLFLRKAAGRAKKNRIKMLKQDDGMVTKDKGEMENMADTFSGFIHGRSCCATIGTMGSL
jgi:hypothetical protein